MAIPSDSTTLWLDLDMGKVHAARGEWDCAINAFTQAIDFVDRQVVCPRTGTEPPYKAYCEAHYERGMAYAHKAKHDQAISDFDAVIAKAKIPAAEKSSKKYLIASHLQRGMLLFSQGDARLAIDDFTQVTRLQRHHSEAFYLRALAYMETGEEQLGQEDFERANRIDPFGYPKLQRAFIAKSCATFPDRRFAHTLRDEGPLSDH